MPQGGRYIQCDRCKESTFSLNLPWNRDGELYLMSRGDEHALWIWVEEFDEWRVLERWHSYQDNVGALNHYRNQIHAGRLTIAELSEKAEPPSPMRHHPLYGRF